MSHSSDLSPDYIYCSSCWKVIRKDSTYCQYCGSYQNYLYEQKLIRKGQKHWQVIKSIIIFYVIYLTSVLPLYWLEDNQVAKGLIIISFIDIFIILGYWYKTRVPILPLFRLNHKTFGYMIIGFFLAIPLFLLNFTYHYGVNQFFRVEPQEITSPFIEGGFGILVTLFSVCLMPAIWEEISFRGLIQGQLTAIFPKKEAILIASILFAIIHCVVLSWFYLFIFGIVLGYLRFRSQSLWPSIVLHFFHNLIIVIFRC